jgi:hypothetical protein
VATHSPTLGTGDIVPQTAFYRVLMVLEAAVGFSVLTMTLTYVLSVYSALIRRNTFALNLQHRTVSTGDAAQLLARLGPGGDFGGARQDLADMASDLLNLLESHHFYSVLHYFRFREPYYALPRMVLVTIETVTLIKSTLDRDTYRTLVRSAAVAELWGGGLHLLQVLSESFLPADRPGETDKLTPAMIDPWQVRYYEALECLRVEGIATFPDIESGMRRYVALRQEWEADIKAFAAQLSYTWEDVAPTSSSVQPDARYIKQDV